MPKRKRKVRTATVGDFPEYELDWETIQAAYGYPLTKPLRREIELTTVRFVARALFERGAVSVDDARNALNHVLSTAQQLIDAISLQGERVDGATHAARLIRYNIHDEWLPSLTDEPYQDPLGVVSHILTSCVTACRTSLEKLEDPGWIVQEGNAWRLWIKDLSEILAKASLTVAARKDDADPSPFVSLVKELQLSLPAQCRRHVQSDQALALAIARARVAIT